MLTKRQAKANETIRAWLTDTPIKQSSRDKVGSVPELTEDYVKDNYTPRNVREYGQFYTPEIMCSELWGYVPVPHYSDNRYRVLDPCAGIGNLIADATSCCDVTAYEIDSEAAEIGKRLHPTANWIVGNGLELPESEYRTFDYVVCNPPYNVPTQANGFAAAKSEYRFLELALRALRPGGSALFICSSNFQEKLPKPLAKLIEDSNACLQWILDLRGDFALTSVRVSLFYLEVYDS